MSLAEDSPVHSSSSDDFAAILDAELDDASDPSSHSEEGAEEEESSDEEDDDEDEDGSNDGSDHERCHSAIDLIVVTKTCKVLVCLLLRFYFW